jgi:hypothetical protein
MDARWLSCGWAMQCLERADWFRAMYTNAAPLLGRHARRGQALSNAKDEAVPLDQRARDE